jgi:hypothetical protein
MAANDRPLNLDELTTGEKAKLALIGARIAKRSLAGPDVHLDDLYAKSDRITDAARKRADQKNK